MRTVVEMTFGSRLYGTATADSDIDIRGVFLPSAADLLLQTDHHFERKSPINARKAADELDQQSDSLKRFLHLAAGGHPAAVEMLFAPKSAIIATSLVWETIVQNRNLIISKQNNAMYGYCRAGVSRVENYTGGRGFISMREFSHIVRILTETIELARDNTITFPLLSAGEILEIKAGRVSIPSIVANIATLWRTLESEWTKSQMRETPDMPWITHFIAGNHLAEIVMDYSPQLRLIPDAPAAADSGSST